KSLDLYYMFSGIGAPEVLIIAIFILVFFGAKRIPELARGLGQGIKEFRQASDDIKKEIDESSRDINDAVKKDETTSKSK
ncbi:MAG: twin-arginine translocase TatA/TatE family subunit, partial [Gracilimonas sp.]|nr:twin-arginine translocase TatA/TatE family subunit [Gracilimonas sp.]